jgi:hypothetical protein
MDDTDSSKDKPGSNFRITVLYFAAEWMALGELRYCLEELQLHNTV